MTVSEKIARLLDMEAAAHAAPWTASAKRGQDCVWLDVDAPDEDEILRAPTQYIGNTESPEYAIALGNITLTAALRNASRPLLLALQALLVERSLEGMHQYDDFIKARKLADAALKELEYAAI